jgi:hypothetical protein
VELSGVIGLIVLLVFGALMFAAARLRLGERFSLRPIDAYQALPQQLSRAVESGGSLHVSLGTGGVGSTDTMTSLAGASVLEHLADQAAAANAPPVVTVADGTLLPVAQDTLRRAFVRRGRREQYQPAQVLMFTPHPGAYAAAAMAIAEDRATSGNVLVGSFGPEMALLAEAAARSGMPQVAGAAEPLAQALLYPTADYVLYGEELFAAGPYLGERRAAGRLVAQDAVRLLIVVAIVIFAIVNSVQG